MLFEFNGYAPEEVIGQSPKMFQGPLTDRKTLDKIRHALENWQPIRAEILNYKKDGTTYWNELEIVPIANDQGWFTHWVSVQRIVTDRKLLEAENHKLAFYDPLTNLPNRRLLADRLEQTFLAMKRSDHHAAYMVLDIDNFKPLNDKYGHRLGDCLLIEIANRLKKCVREVDSIARYGGDEFVVLLHELDGDLESSKKAAASIAEKIRSNLSIPYILSTSKSSHESIVHLCTASIGVVVFGHDTVNAQDVFDLADAAMYESKERGRNQVSFHPKLTKPRRLKESREKSFITLLRD